MNRLMFWLIGLGLALSIAGCMPSDIQEEKPPLLDRNLFFGNPEISGAQISPDGNYVAFRKPYKDVMNIWVKESGADFEDAQPITADTTRPVRGYFWSKNSEYILYVQDKGGDENFNIYAVDPSAEAGDLGVPQARNLTNLENVRAQILAVPDATPNEIIVGLNDRNPQLHDVYRLNIESGERELIRQNNEGIAGWVVDNDGELRLGVRQTQSGGTELLRVDEDELVNVFEVDNEETLNPIRFHKNNEQLYMATNKDRNLSSLFLFNPQTEELSLVEADPEKEVDFNGAIFSNETEELLATTYVGDRLRIYPKDEQFKRDYEVMKSELPDGEINFGAHTSDDEMWVINVEQDVDPGSTYLYNRSDESLAMLYESRPELESNHLAEMKPIRYTARDGLEIPAYLTLPKGYGEGNLPVIVYPHGGPWARDTWGYDPMVQFLANRGYAVFQPNFRGSAGYGKEFLNAGNEEWGTGFMQHDITDGVEYLIEEGIADSSRVAIYGGSYGGYATLAGLAFTPDLYAAGVSFVGPSNIITLLNSIPPYWEPIRKIFSVRVGDLDDPEDVERMKKQSPLFSADQIEAPLMVIQGANDPRVKKQESDQIVQALRELDREVQYIVAPDEGHGFAREENRIAAFTAMEEFFADHIGGRYQEDMKQEIAERLKEITVDISTVDVEGIEE